MDPWSLVVGAIVGYVINEIVDLLRAFLNKVVVRRFTTEKEIRQFTERIVKIRDIIEVMEERYGEGHGEEKLAGAVEALLRLGYAESAEAAVKAINEVFVFSRYYHG